MEESFVSSHEEAIAIIESLRQDITNFEGELFDGVTLNALLKDYLGVSEETTAPMIEKMQFRMLALSKNHQRKQKSHDDDDSDDDDGEVDNSSVTSSHLEVETADDNADGDDGGSVLGHGECALCERRSKLMRHHLISKSTWSRLETKLLRMVAAAAAVSPEATSLTKTASCRTSIDKCSRYALDDGQSPIIRIRASKGDSGDSRRVKKAGTVRDVLTQQTIDLCRTCHNHIHQTHDNWTLALQYYTLDKLMADPATYTFTKWASRQKRSGK